VMQLYRARSASLWVLLAFLASGLPGTRAAESAPDATPPKVPSAASSTPPKAAPVPSKEGSYDVGLMLGGQLEHNGVVPILSVDAVIRGLKDSIGGRAVTPAERETALRFLHDAREVLAEKNKAEARKFLERNAKAAGVKIMPSGVQYRVLATGDAKGKTAAPADEVTVRYRASLADGTEIDRSDIHDRPATFRVNSVIKGWQEAFLAMKPGDKWQLFVPPDLAYGSNPPPTIPPGALLVYEMELLRIDAATPVDLNAVKSHRNPPAAAPATH
jgi:FKBP-type peptidyl-prolyl cis-trans isomerase FklB